ncbi:uncharacterized protein RSE6_02016 [Rhynchosporium secalis]|uniref:Transcription factor domain-containing protein n=1 Tax=Rhynchosporium secalis TaxID=38038 RepID=A0A1E1LZ72_RHYSE|nr:uncharacterized protein RSE6_02016 [Rhynchosporium secalis]
MSPMSHSRSYPSYRGDLMISSHMVVDPTFEWTIPEGGLLDPFEHNSMKPSPGLDPEDYPAGSIPVFSGRGTEWVDQLLGDRCFSTMVEGLQRPVVTRNLGAPSKPADILPSYRIAESSVRGFLFTVNRETPLFEEDVIALDLNIHKSGSHELKAGYIAAINIMIAFQIFRCFPIRYTVDVDTEAYLANALALLPRLIVEDPSTLNISAVLCIVSASIPDFCRGLTGSMKVLYFVFSNHKTGANILGIAIQMMVTAGYNTQEKEPSARKLFQKRLFWNACMMSSDISIYLGKAPAILDPIVAGFPERFPTDSNTDVRFQDGSTLNVIYERFELSRIQGKVWLMLYSPNALQLPHQQIYENVAELDHELEVWKSRVPDYHGDDLYDGNQCRLIYLTFIHLRYHQLVIYIHSVLFTRASDQDPQVRKLKASPSVARCVQAARGCISLLDHFNENHHFMCILAPNLAWCCDILCIHVLQNKNTSGAHEDIARLERVAKNFEKFARESNSKFQSQVTNMLYFIAAYGVRVSNTVLEQPVNAVYVHSLTTFPSDTFHQNNIEPMSMEVMAQTENYPAQLGVPLAQLGVPLAPKPHDGLPLRNVSSVGTNLEDGGRKIFFHSHTIE